MGDLLIRKCEYKDLEEVLKLQESWENENITYGFVSADKIYLQNKLGEYFYIAEIDSKVVGFIYGTVHESKNMSIFHEGEQYIEVDDIYVNQGTRDLNIGSELIDKLLEVAKKEGIERSLIYSSTKDIDSIIKFYKKHDYKTWYIQMYK
ncbi:GNAT family N-acetyltransferase [Clostridium ihumii]|uniref:GNAT family N-acetyltransferase n=1 Tax=Clostridium ihumii TaxID=1470356 RepID=UPI003D340D74